MKKHQYRITVDYLADNSGNLVEVLPLVFEAPNHDNLFELLEKVKQTHPDISEQDLSRFLIGLKLFGEVILENRHNPFFARFSPMMKEIMMTLKGGK
ncbi:protein of unknown function [Moraxella cuniculi DSM 21768]|uniref:DUF3861 domain-containing protein n=1 Tax=Moraxella cuniculi DSM 21768 TaxID=1122245 RepID=A0A1N7FUR2_9GAMM|nr:DUF3861 domain-containing protein [Moraxella cuniculi]OOS05480.1 hypothetical protein B0189_06425 [Moraxella cuniculi]SIS04098.1 protein of unknown function [Moraxella cuniculi DSM 21768]